MSAPDINFKSKQDITSIVGRDFVVDASKGDFSFESQYFTMESTNTGSPRNLTLTDKDKTVYLKLNKSSMSYLHNDYGFNCLFEGNEVLFCLVFHPVLQRFWLAAWQCAFP